MMDGKGSNRRREHDGEKAGMATSKIRKRGPKRNQGCGACLSGTFGALPRHVSFTRRPRALTPFRLQA